MNSFEEQVKELNNKTILIKTKDSLKLHLSIDPDPEFPYSVTTFKFILIHNPHIKTTTVKLLTELPADIKSNIESQVQRACAVMDLKDLVVWIRDHLEELMVVKKISFVKNTGGSGIVSNFQNSKFEEEKKAREDKKKTSTIHANDVVFHTRENVTKADFHFNQVKIPPPSGYIVELDAKVEQIALYSFSKIGLRVHCNKCQHITELFPRPHTELFDKCSKCKKSLTVQFTPDTCNPMKHVIGYVQTKACKLVDIFGCDMMVMCENCPNAVFCLTDFNFGGKNEYRCFFCRSTLAIYCSKYTLTEIKLPVQTKKQILPKNTPLPNQGACIHYKKSFKWFRFPCCHKLYPCDTCHDNEEDHISVHANKIVCGNCSLEQVIGDNCQCGFQLSGKSSTYWEGGKGTRDKVKMSKKDSHKYKGLSKTVSKKKSTKK